MLRPLLLLLLQLLLLLLLLMLLLLLLLLLRLPLVLSLSLSLSLCLSLCLSVSLSLSHRRCCSVGDFLATAKMVRVRGGWAVGRLGAAQRSAACPPPPPWPLPPHPHTPEQRVCDQPGSAQGEVGVDGQAKGGAGHVTKPALIGQRPPLPVQHQCKRVLGTRVPTQDGRHEQKEDPPRAVPHRARPTLALLHLVRSEARLG